MKSSFGRQERRRDRRVRQTKEGGYYHIVLSGKLVITEENGREPTRGGVVCLLGVWLWARGGWEERKENSQQDSKGNVIIASGRSSRVRQRECNGVYHNRNGDHGGSVHV